MAEAQIIGSAEPISFDFNKSVDNSIDSRSRILEEIETWGQFENTPGNVENNDKNNIFDDQMMDEINFNLAFFEDDKAEIFPELTKNNLSFAPMD